MHHNHKIRQKFTEGGVLGVILLIVGPTLAGFARAAITPSARTFGEAPPDVGWLYVVGALGILMTILAFPLVIVGRQYLVESGNDRD
ncbi:hypothetical protein [Hoeflea sp. 108]|jgi:hypothetical protein|uniref:hypothetical protein n=1 Tax=Hoeflea sp. 108 TaxID=1116369 RepID=UPI00036C4376|nr:hypothetical protein [Hoeflea sp. 108]